MAKNIEPSLRLISDYLTLNNNEIFLIPEYQRAYSWDISHCDKLWNDIEDFIDLDETDPYFFGTVIIDCSNEDLLNLIDGQQRTLTFILLLRALLIKIIDVLKDFSSDESAEALEEGLKESRNKIMSILYKADIEKRINITKKWSNVIGVNIINSHSINELHKDEIISILQEEDFNTIESKVHKFPRKQKDNKYTNYFRNFKYFYDKLNDKNESSLNLFAKTFLYKCQIIEIKSWQIEQAITMFNSLNSTGMPLSVADIIAARLYSNSGDNKQEFNNKWLEFNAVTDRLKAIGVTDIDSILQQYMYISRAIEKSYINNNSVNVTTPGLKTYYLNNRELLKDPIYLIDRLLEIANKWDKIKNYNVIKIILRMNENIRIYLSSYLYRFDLDSLEEFLIKDVSLDLLRLFSILELVDTGFSSKKFKTFLFDINTKLVDKNISNNKIHEYFDNHIMSNWNKNNIIELLRDYDRNILVILNEFLCVKKKNKLFDLNRNINIEHIMPMSGRNIKIIQKDARIKDDEEFKFIVNKLGNKILLEENINKSIGNQWFKSKKQSSIKDKTGYINSIFPEAIALTKFPSDSWTVDDILERTETVSKRLVKFIFNKQSKLN